MKLALFAPYAAQHKDVALLFLVANYLAKNGAEVAFLRCDGGVAACGRDPVDRVSGPKRGLFDCIRCLNEQAALAAWSSSSVVNLSAQILPDDVRTTQSWISKVASDELARVEFRGMNLWSACRNEINRRLLSRLSGDLAREQQGFNADQLTEAEDSEIRQLFISYVRTAVASERFLKGFQPTLVLVSSISDPLAHAFVLPAKQLGLDVGVGWCDMARDSIGIESLATRQRYETGIVLDGLVSMRSDPRTWGPEIKSIVHEALTFLGCAGDRMG